MRTATFLMVLASATAHTPNASPQFEVASIKPSASPGSGRMRVGSRGGPGTNDPALYSCENCPVSWLVADAFDLRDYELSGPDWMQSTRFMVTAKIPDGTTKDQFRVMKQNLLADRFKLAFHREKKEMQSYDLVVAKGGPKMRESPGPLDPEERPRPLTERKLDAEGFPVLPPGRVPIMMMMSGGRATARHAEQTMEITGHLFAAQHQWGRLRCGGEQEIRGRMA